KQTKDLARPHVEADRIHGGGAPVALGQSPYADHHRGIGLPRGLHYRCRRIHPGSHSLRPSLFSSAPPPPLREHSPYSAGTAGRGGRLSPPRRRRAVSSRPRAGTWLVAAARPKTGMLP